MAACSGGSQHEDRSPNVIFIIADDLGYGDLSCYGQERFGTPNIDSLAADGVMFTRHNAGTSVSAPSRSSLITGLYTGHTPIRGNKELPVKGQHPIPGDTYNIYRLMKSQGYVTGVFGKWGLGAPSTEGAPEAQGVDEFYGYNCQRLAHHYYPYHLWHNSEKVILKGNEGTDENDYSPYLIHEQALDFIRKHSDSTFFMMYTSIIPHAELRLPETEIEPFLGKPEPEKSYKGCDGGPGYRQAAYGSQEHCHAAFAAMVSVLDRQVGEIHTLLDSLGISDNTIVVFTSDNGPHIEGGADPAYFNSNGGLRGIKRDLYEGGIRVPFIMTWPGHIEGGRTTDHISAFWDFLPTLADITGASRHSRTLQHHPADSPHRVPHLRIQLKKLFHFSLFGLRPLILLRLGNANQTSSFALLSASAYFCGRLRHHEEIHKKTYRRQAAASHALSRIHGQHLAVSSCPHHRRMQDRTLPSLRR